MSEGGAYGDRLATRFRIETAPSFLARSLQDNALAVTEIKCDIENNGLTAPIPREDALLVTLQLKFCPAHDLWIDGKPAKTAPLPAGAVSIYDLRASPIANSISAFHNLHFYFPRAALDAINDAEGAPPCREIAHNPGEGFEDPVIQGLGRSLLPAFERPDEANTLFVDYATTAAAAYVARLLSGAGPLPSATGALSSDQLERVPGDDPRQPPRGLEDRESGGGVRDDGRRFSRRLPQNGRRLVARMVVAMPGAACDGFPEKGRDLA